MDEIERLNNLSSAEREAERRRLKARSERLARYEPDTPEMYRADATQPTIKAVVLVDQTGRKITEFRGEPGSMKSWMQQWMTPPYVQLGIYNGGDPAEFRRRMQRKIAAYDAALAGGR
ncbi:hypothetical protein [Paraburkholderia sediminicola]|uniref:hypothetical protein n=1 Tax=Paraburkholderia sediminicola TaxID=458836 RepID=UPI0038BB8DCF